MTEGVAALLGALIGATGGIAGGGLAALASLRASQIAARAPLGPILHEMGKAFVRMNVTKDMPEEYFDHRLEFEHKWNEFSIQQRILCPSKTITNLMALVMATARDQTSNSADLSSLSGQVVEKVTQMVGAYSNRLFRFEARRDEKRIIRSWLKSPETQSLSPGLRAKLDELTRGPLRRLLRSSSFRWPRS